MVAPMEAALRCYRDRAAAAKRPIADVVMLEGRRAGLVRICRLTVSSLMRHPLVCMLRHYSCHGTKILYFIRK